MLKHLFIEKTLEALDNIILEIEDRDDKDDFRVVVDNLHDIRDEMDAIDEEDG